MNEQQSRTAQQPANDLAKQGHSNSQKTPHLLNTEEFIMRYAQDLRAKGDPDLPLTFYAEQARQLLLSGKHPKDITNNPAVTQAVNDHVYQSWALGKS